MWKGILVCLLTGAWCALLMSWTSFADPDAFYHATISRLLWEHGPLVAFPWLDLTTLGTSFADHHALFHVIEAPFVMLFGLANGARLVTVFLSMLFFAVVYAVFRWMKIRFPLLWILLLVFSGPFMARLLLGKATPLALIWFVLGLVAAWKRRPWVVGVVAALFALSHGGWLYLLGSIVLLSIGSISFSRIVEDRSWRESIRSSEWREILAAFVGAGMGTMMHPNFPENLSFLWVQIFKIGIKTPFQHVILGSEWLPVNPGWMMAAIAPWLMLLVLGIAGIYLARREPLDRHAARAVVAFALPVAALLALTFKSRRSVEYLIPAFVLWIPWFWNMIDIPRLRAVFLEAFSPFMRRVVVLLLCIAAVGLVWKQTSSAYAALHREMYPDTVFQDAFSEISRRANPGDRVFHSDWDEFPILWSIDDRLKYVVGLDPTFLYEASPELSNAYRDVTWGRTQPTIDDVWHLVHDQLGARFLFIDKRDHVPLLEIVKQDPRYELLRETVDAASFMVVDPLSLRGSAKQSFCHPDRSASGVEGSVWIRYEANRSLDFVALIATSLGMTKEMI